MPCFGPFFVFYYFGITKAVDKRGMHGMELPDASARPAQKRGCLPTESIQPAVLALWGDAFSFFMMI